MVSRARSTLWPWLIALALVGPALAAPEIEVSFSPEEPYENQSIRVTIRVSGDGALDARLDGSPPRGDGLLPAGRPSTSQQTYSVNGRTQSWLEYGITYVPQRAGLVSLPSFTFITAAGKVETEPISLEVREGSAPGARAPDREAPLPLEVVVRPSARSAYLGEKITLEYVLRDGGARPRGIEPDRLDPLPGFLIEDDELDVAATARETTDAQGRPWVEYTLFRRRLTPTRTGTIEIPPVEIRTSVPRRRRDAFGSAFGFERYVPVSLVARGLAIEVRPLPEDGRPPDFEGAVGSFTLRAKIPEDARVGEAFQLELEVSGEGSLDTLEPPELVLPPDLQAYEPVEGPRVARKRTWTYPLVARAPGEARIAAPSISYFDPGFGRYETASVGPFSVNVLPGRTRTVEAAREGPAPGGGARIEELGSDLRFVEAAPRRLVSRESHLGQRRVYWFAIGFPFLALPLFAFALRLASIRAASETGRVARTLRDARRTLDEASQTSSPEDAARCVVRALHTWCGLVIGEPSRPLERSRLRRALEERSGDAELASRVVDLLDRAEAARYGGADPGSLVDEAGQVITQGTGR